MVPISPMIVAEIPYSGIIKGFAIEILVHPI